MSTFDTPGEVTTFVLSELQKQKERLEKRLQDSPVGSISKSSEMIIDAKINQLDLLYHRFKAQLPPGS